MSTALDLTPAPASAPRSRRILTQARTEATLMLRNGEQLILALVIPIGLLVAGLLWGGRLGLDPALLPPSVLALALWSTSFTSLAIATAFERRYGVLERLVATPLTRGDLIVGKALATASVAALQVAVIAAVALLLGWRPGFTVASLAVALAAVALALVTFAGFALAVAGRLRAEATLAVANLVYLVAAAGGALVLPLAAYPAWAHLPLSLTPFAALGETLRLTSVGALPLIPLLVLAAWAALALLVARKAFRWTS
ncbi:MAG: ABC transporter permease [Propionibacteriaceae bacterium]|nr:ABC transporter permease [Propionibacteriaceae bacterium]